MTFDPRRTSRANRDRRDQSFARSVIAEATRLHNATCTCPTMANRALDPDPTCDVHGKHPLVSCRGCGKQIRWSGVYGDWCAECKPRTL